MGVGRLDVMLYPYYKKDIESGIISEDEAFELLEEFFLTFNIDSDFYIGVQQGDNGQSLMVGGCDADGNLPSIPKIGKDGILTVLNMAK